MHTRLNLSLLLLFLVMPFGLVHADKQPLRFKVTELVELPHPMSAIRQDPERFGITAEQRERLDKELIAVFPPEIHPRMQRAWELQNRIRRSVMKQGRDSVTLKAELDELSGLKREIANLHIDALGRFRDILSEEQLQQVIAAMDGAPSDSAR